MTLDALVRQLREAMPTGRFISFKHDNEWRELTSPANMATLLDALTAAQRQCEEARGRFFRIDHVISPGDRAADDRWLDAEAEAARLREQVTVLHDKADELSAEVSALQGELAEARAALKPIDADRLALLVESFTPEAARGTLLHLATALLHAQAERDAAREALGTAWDDGVRFAAEVLQSRVYPNAEARAACLERIVAALGQLAEPHPETGGRA